MLLKKMPGEALSSSLAVSVVIPAHNAETTLDETLASLRAQTFTRWEAIVVDDGSIDTTAALAERWAGIDPRIRVIRQAQAGVSVARNAGIKAARQDWLLFLDADDWIAPSHMQRLTAALAAAPDRDAAHCGFVRVMPSGQHSQPEMAPDQPDLFTLLTRCCCLAIHACIIRTDLVRAIGGFDPSLQIGEDWDLWQRAARAGARFTRVPEPLAYYRLRPGSATSRLDRLISDGLIVIRRAHGPDPRLSGLNRPLAHPDGAPADDLPEAMFFLLVWAAALVVGRGENAGWVLEPMGAVQAPRFHPLELAWILWATAPQGAAVTLGDWNALWPKVADALARFLVDAEARSGVPKLAARTRTHLEPLILGAIDLPEPTVFGNTYVVPIDLRRPIPDITVPAGSERLLCRIGIAGRRVGDILFPATVGTFSGAAIAEAVAGSLSGYLVRRHFRALATGPRLWRGLAGFALRLATGRTGVALPTDRAGLRNVARAAVRHLARTGALVRAEPPGPEARAASARLDAIIGEERRLAGAPATLPAAPLPNPWADPRPAVSDQLAILTYHRIGAMPPGGTDRFTVTPERFAQHLACLRTAGCHAVTPADWAQALARLRPLPGRPVLITFDDGYRDFPTTALPLLRRYGFTATLFLVAEQVGGTAEWEPDPRNRTPLLSWPEIRELRDAGITFGAHSTRHVPLTGLAPEPAVRDGARARAILERELERPVTALAYPYGDHDEATRRAMAAAGYTLGLTWERRISHVGDDPMRLPRIEISGADDLDAFIAKLSGYRGLS